MADALDSKSGVLWACRFESGLGYRIVLLSRRSFQFRDIERECEVQSGCFRLDGGRGQGFGLRVRVPEALRSRYPYAGSAYAFLQELRLEIFEHGLIVFPDLPVNRTNHTLAQRAPEEHAYSPNRFLTDLCQEPHQDTPPYPTAFWLGAARRFSASWVVSEAGARDFYGFRARHPELSIEEVHRRLVPSSLREGRGLLLNQDPGLLLIDNSHHRRLYHARTRNFEALLSHEGEMRDAPMYAFNEMGLLHHIDSLDIRRGAHDRDADDQREVEAFLAAEGSLS